MGLTDSGGPELSGYDRGIAEAAFLRAFSLTGDFKHARRVQMDADDVIDWLHLPKSLRDGVAVLLRTGHAIGPATMGSPEIPMVTLVYSDLPAPEDDLRRARTKKEFRRKLDLQKKQALATWPKVARPKDRWIIERDSRWLYIYHCEGQGHDWISAAVTAMVADLDNTRVSADVPVGARGVLGKGIADFGVRRGVERIAKALQFDLRRRRKNVTSSRQAHKLLMTP